MGRPIRFRTKKEFRIVNRCIMCGRIIPMGYAICSSCDLPITSSQKIKTLDGKKFHVKPCFRQIMKQGRKEAFGWTLNFVKYVWKK